MIDLTDALDSLGPFADVVRLAAPPPFEWSGNITYTVGDQVHVGPGFVNATVESIGVQMQYEVHARGGIGEVAVIDDRAPGKIVAPERFGTLSGRTGDSFWLASGGVIIRTTGNPPTPTSDFHVADVKISGYSTNAAAYTRLTFYGPRLPFCAK